MHLVSACAKLMNLLGPAGSLAPEGIDSEAFGRRLPPAKPRSYVLDLDLVGGPRIRAAIIVLHKGGEVSQKQR